MLSVEGAAARTLQLEREAGEASCRSFDSRANALRSRMAGIQQQLSELTKLASDKWSALHETRHAKAQEYEALPASLEICCTDGMLVLQRAAICLLRRASLVVEATIRWGGGSGGPCAAAPGAAAAPAAGAGSEETAHPQKKLEQKAVEKPEGDELGGSELPLRILAENQTVEDVEWVVRCAASPSAFYADMEAWIMLRLGDEGYTKLCRLETAAGFWCMDALLEHTQACRRALALQWSTHHAGRVAGEPALLQLALSLDAVTQDLGVLSELWIEAARLGSEHALVMIANAAPTPSFSGLYRHSLTPLSRMVVTRKVLSLLLLLTPLTPLPQDVAPARIEEPPPPLSPAVATALSLEMIHEAVRSHPYDYFYLSAALNVGLHQPICVFSGATAMEVAAGSGHVELARLLNECGVYPNHTILWRAVDAGHDAMAAMLIGAGALFTPCIDEEESPLAARANQEWHLAQDTLLVKAAVRYGMERTFAALVGRPRGGEGEEFFAEARRALWVHQRPPSWTAKLYAAADASCASRVFSMRAATLQEGSAQLAVQVAGELLGPPLEAGKWGAARGKWESKWHAKAMAQYLYLLVQDCQLENSSGGEERLAQAEAIVRHIECDKAAPCLGRLIGRRVGMRHVSALSRHRSPAVQLESISEAFRCGGDEAIPRAAAILEHGAVALFQSFKAVYHAIRHGFQTPLLRRSVLRMVAADQAAVTFPSAAAASSETAASSGTAAASGTGEQPSVAWAADEAGATDIKVYALFVMKCILRFATRSSSSIKYGVRILTALTRRRQGGASVATLLLQGLTEALYDHVLQRACTSPAAQHLTSKRVAAHYATLLCRAGASPEGVPSLVQGARGTPLQVAVLAQQHALVRLLLSEGAQPLGTCAQCGVLPVRLAARHAHTLMDLDALLQYGGDAAVALAACEDAIEFQPRTALAVLHAAYRWLDGEGKAEWKRRWHGQWKAWRCAL